MTRTLIIRLLLSLLLLMSQQMGMVHAISHWAGAAQAQGQAQVDGEREGDLAKAVAVHASCDKCLAFAQIAGAVGNLPRGFAGADAAANAVAAAIQRPAAARSIPAFHSRAPP